MAWLSLTLSFVLGLTIGFIRALNLRKLPEKEVFAIHLCLGGSFGLISATVILRMHLDDLERGTSIIGLMFAIALIAVKLERCLVDLYHEITGWAFDDPNRPRYLNPDSDPPSPAP